MKKLLIVLGAVVLLHAIVAGIGVWQVERFMSSPVQVPDDGATFAIAPGSSFSAVADRLVERGIIENARWFRLYARWSGKAGSIHAGEYEIAPGTTPRALLEQFTSGAVRLYSFTLVEGWNHRDLLAALQANEAVVSSMTDEDWPVLLAELGAAVTHPEGLFLPETYRFPRGTTDREVLAQAYDLMQEVLAEEWAEKGQETPVTTPYEALVLASIVEKETALAEERPRIAGVFARRLEKRMRLQTDPTVIYGIGPDFDGNLTREHLRTDTPYNTYTRRGLPPTPIAMPGRAAIHAVLHPAEGPELFFVATGLGDGSHKFSATKPSMTWRLPSTCNGCASGGGRGADMTRGKFITVEGIEGVGKSTNIAAVVESIRAAGHEVLTTREPGGTPFAEDIRDILMNRGDEPVPAIAELLLMFAARSFNVTNVIVPALEAGTWVVCDRFTDSTRAYQGGGRGIPMETIDRIANWVHGDTWPDLTILLDAPVDVGMARAGSRGEPDRFEQEQHEFFERVRACYLQLAEAEKERFIVVDTTRPIERVSAEVVAVVERLIANK